MEFLFLSGSTVSSIEHGINALNEDEDAGSPVEESKG
jgi:hypothetical protein